MKNYNNGKIYKIEPTCEHDEWDIYFGSTMKQSLYQIMAYHKYHYRKYKNGSNFNFRLSSFIIFDKYGLDNVKIVLVENVNSKDELITKESQYIRNAKCVNSYIPDITKRKNICIKKLKLKKTIEI